MICAHYYFVLNHAPHKYQHYVNIHKQKYIRHKNVFEKDGICQENLYQRNNHLMVLSSNKKELGIVKYMSKGAFELYGKNVVNNHICAILPDEFKDTGYAITNAVLEVVDQAYYDQLIPAITYNYTGKFFTQCDQYYNVSPLLGQGLYILFFARIPSNSQQFIMLRENGDLIGFTERLGQILGLFEYRRKLSKHSEININIISKKLARVNQAFNMITSPEKYLSAHSSNLQIEEAQNLYDIFSTTGEELPLKYAGHKDKDKYLNYRCKFETKFYAGILVKAIVVQSTSDVEFSVGTKTEASTEQLEIGTRIPLQSYRDDESEGSIASEDIIKALPNRETIVAKDDVLSQDKSNTPMKFSDYHQAEMQSLEKRDTNLFSTDQDYLSHRRLLSPREFTPRLEMTPKLSTNAEGLNTPTSHNLNFNKKKEHETMIQQGPKPVSEHQSQIGRRVDANQLSKDYESALNSKYYQHYFRFLIVVFYIIFLGILGSNIYTTQYFEENIQILEARKNALRLVIARTDQLTNFYGQANRLYAFAKGKQNESLYPESYRSPATLQRTIASLSQFSQSNKNVMLSMDSLDSESQDRLSLNNVSFYDTKPNKTSKPVLRTDTFQATEIMIETGYRLVRLASISLQAALTDFSSIITNAPNDLLNENQQIAFSFVVKVYDQRDFIIKSNRVSLVLSLSLVAFIFVAFCLIVLKQYRQAKHNMLALTKLDTGEVTKLMEKVTTFQSMIQDEANFEELQSMDIYDSSKITQERDRKKNEKGKGGYTQRSDFQKKFWWYPIKFLALTSIVTGLLLAKFFVIQDSANDLSYIVTQLYFMDRSAPRTRLATLMTLDILADNTTTIRSSPVLKEFDKEIYFAQNITHNLTDYLRNRDNTYDPVIQGILFDNACNYVTPISFLIQSCSLISQNLQNVGLVQFMTGYQGLLIDFRNQYQISNKSKEALAALGATLFIPIATPMTIMCDLMATISTRLNNIFSTTITNSSRNNDLTSSFLFVTLVIIGLIIHIYVINRVKETENDFKNVLKAFPAKLVLSNFMLKSYLTRTWKDMSNSSRLLTGE